MRFVVIIFLASLLISCASVEKTRIGLNNLVGKDIQIAIYVLGYPTSKEEFAGDTVYVWSVDEYGQISLPNTTYITGSVGMTPIYGAITGSTTRITRSICNIKIITNASGIIKGKEIDGNYSGCSNYMYRLGEYADSSAAHANPRNNNDLRTQSAREEDAAIYSGIDKIQSNNKEVANFVYGVFNKRVVLVGEIASVARGETIVQEVSNIKGVAKVFNELRYVGLLSHKSHDLDSAIQQAILHRVNGSTGVNSTSFEIVVFNGEAYFLGMAKQEVAQRIAETAASTRGVKKSN